METEIANRVSTAIFTAMKLRSAIERQPLTQMPYIYIEVDEDAFAEIYRCDELREYGIPRRNFDATIGAPWRFDQFDVVTTGKSGDGITVNTSTVIP